MVVALAAAPPHPEDELVLHVVKTSDDVVIVNADEYQTGPVLRWGEKLARIRQVAVASGPSADEVVLDVEEQCVAVLEGRLDEPKKGGDLGDGGAQVKIMSSLRSCDSGLHPAMQSPDLPSCIRLVRAEALLAMDVPLPRCQDVDDSCFGVPTSSDLVVAVSHGWRYQTHPDPGGSKFSNICEFIQQCMDDVSGSVFVFLDFLSISQRPFRADQADRNAEESVLFKAALGCMHEMYMHADRVIHISFEGDVLDGEGLEYAVQVSELQGVSLCQMGDWVQIIKTSSFCDSFLFHRVVAVGGEKVTTLNDVSGIGHGEGRDDLRPVTLASYPFGRVNVIPADQRGWVFLERFITSVKCAMLSGAEASQVVLSDAPFVKAAILERARNFRQAAARRSSFALESALEASLAELATKRFSAASTDKILLDSGQASASVCKSRTSTGSAKGLSKKNPATNADRLVVEGIMRGFVDHVKEHWAAEVVLQQHRAALFSSLLLSNVGEYLLEWECLSPEQVRRIEEASRRSAWPLLAVIILPSLPALLTLLWKFSPPSAGWKAQGHWFIVVFLNAAVVFYFFPLFLIALARVPRSCSSVLKMVLWSMVVSGTTMAITVCVAAGADIWPIPFAPFIGLFTCLGFIPVLWCMVPANDRRNRTVRRRFLAAAGTLVLIVFLFATILPILNVVLASTSSVAWHCVVIFGFLVCKLVFEHICLKLAPFFGADVMPYVIYFATVAYEINMCIAMSSGFSVVPFIELLFFDLTENAFLVWSLHRTRLQQRRESQCHTDGKKHYVAVAVVLREFIELASTATFLCHVLFARSVRPEMNVLLCSQTEAEYKQMLIYIVIDGAIEIASTCLTFSVLRRHGLQPVQLLIGLSREYGHVFISSAAASWIYYWAAFHTHAGMDSTLQFQWLKDPKSAWQCGLWWTPS